MRQGAEQSAPTSLPCTITCMIMLIIVNRIQFLYYSSYSFLYFSGLNIFVPHSEGFFPIFSTSVPPAVRSLWRRVE